MSLALGARRGRATRWQRVAVPYLYLAPFLILFIAFRIAPLVYGLYLSLTNAQLGADEYVFVGLRNFERIWLDRRFVTSLGNTGTFALETTIPVLGLPLVLALILNRAVALRTLLRSAFFFPFTLSAVTVGLVWAWLLDPVVGPFMIYLKSIGIPTHPWLGDPSTAMWAIVLANVWSATGYYLVIYLAALQDVPRQLLEAAELDGANAWQRFWSVVFPLLRPVLLFIVVVHIIGAFQIFGLVYVMTNGGPADSTLTIVQYIYILGFQNSFNIGRAASMSWILFAVILVFSAIQFRLLGQRTE
jgi:multiple sugar transport system permease protein